MALVLAAFLLHRPCGLVHCLLHLGQEGPTFRWYPIGGVGNKRSVTRHITPCRPQAFTFQAMANLAVAISRIGHGLAQAPQTHMLLAAFDMHAASLPPPHRPQVRGRTWAGVPGAPCCSLCAYCNAIIGPL